MRTIPEAFVCGVLLAAALGRADGMLPPDGVATNAFQRDCEALCRAPHRLAGTPEGGAAAAYIEQRLRETGVDRVIAQQFATAELRVRRCELLIEGRDSPIPLLPVRPDGIIPPVTPPAGLDGRLVYAADGSLEVLAARDVNGAIAVMDYNCGDGWIRAFRFGAKAVIFVPNGVCEAWHSHCVSLNANLPRFYFAGSPADLLAVSGIPLDALRNRNAPGAGRSGRLHSEGVWAPATGRNILGFIQGTDPVFAQGKEELILIAANLDAYGEVPQRSPGARSAANCAAVLKLAGHFRAHRPRRHVLLAFFDGEARGHAGSSAFYRALEDEARNDGARVATRRRCQDEERAFLTELLRQAEAADPLSGESGARRGLLIRLDDKAAEKTSAIHDQLLRLRQSAVRRSDQGVPPRKEPNVAAEVERRIREDILPEKDGWNRVRRAMARGAAGEIGREDRIRLTALLSEVRSDIALRLSELDRLQTAADADAAILDLIGRRWISLHVSLLLGDETPWWGIAIGGQSFLRSWRDNPGLYGKVQSAFLHAFRSLPPARRAATHFVVESADQSLPQTRSLLAAPFLWHSGEIAGLFGVYNLCLLTCQESLRREGTPDDTLDRLDWRLIEQQADEIGGMIAAAPTGDARSAVADQTGLSIRRGIVSGKEYAVSVFRDGAAQGPAVLRALSASSIANSPAPGAVVQFKSSQRAPAAFGEPKPYAFDDFQTLCADRNGIYELGPAIGEWGSRFRGFAAVFDERGMVASSSTTETAGNVRYRLNVLRTRPAALMLPPQVSLDARADRQVRVLSSRSNAMVDRRKSFVEAGESVLAWYTDERERGVKIFGLPQAVALDNAGGRSPASGDASDPLGKGLSMETPLQRLPPAEQSASDLWRLNESRLDVLRRRNIMRNSLEELHGRAGDLLSAAREATGAVQRQALAASSFWSSQPVYREIKTTLDDLMLAVLLLLGIAAPFAFVMERVLIGATTVYRQIRGFALFFFLTFLLLYVSHPAFAIASTPAIIFLGFAILLMASLVIVLVLRRFETELKALQGMTTTVHSADVSSLSTFVAAMQMGVSSMRRRPMRTALTAVTVLLLTFTLLLFASFSMESGVVSLYRAPKPGYCGVWVHNVNWSPLSPDIPEVLTGRFAPPASGGDSRGAECAHRYWISPVNIDTPGILITRGDGSRPVTIRGILGLEPREIARRPDLARILGALPDGTVSLTEATARSLDVRPGDPVILKGIKLNVGRILNAADLASARDMDGSGILPVDFVEMSALQQQLAKADAETDLAALSQYQWTTIPADLVAVVSAPSTRRLGALCHGLTLYTGGESEAAAIAEDAARMLPFPVAASRANGVYLHLLGTVVSASGVRDLFFPLLLGGLVVFGTMLGSVTDREREIYAFSALGLAPRHVAMLFVSESMVYALIGGMGGYLLAAALVNALGTLSEGGLLRVPEMNVSSTNTIVSLLLVMLTVLVSAAYPALKASRSANPGLARAWRLPRPEGNVLDLVFPFTVSEYDITGVVSFLKEHFDNHNDTGLGRFMASGTRLFRDEKGMLGLRSSLALAPFDLGVSQEFELRTTPSEIRGIDEVRVILERRSGQPGDWHRLNRVLLNDVRQQFLIWRSMPTHTMELYRRRTLEIR